MRHLFALCTALLLMTPALRAASVGDLTGLIVLGDSLSDDGKLEGLLAPPSFEGRFSNGRVFTELLADDFKSARQTTLNLAIRPSWSRCRPSGGRSRH